MSRQNQVNLDIEDEVPADGTPRPNPLHRLDSAARTVPPSRNNLGLGDRLNSVFREIRPFVEHARMGNNARLSLPTWLPRNAPGTHNITETSVQRPQSSIAHVNLGPASQTYVVTDRGTPPAQRTSSVNNSVSNELNSPEQEQDHPEINVSVNPANNNNIHDNTDNDSQSDDGSQQVVDVRATLNLLIRYAPFYFILFIKFMYDSKEGLFTFFVLFFTFLHSNCLIRREHVKQSNRSLLTLFCDLSFTLSCVFIVHYLFGHDKLLPNALMIPGHQSVIDVWELMWLVVLSDLIAKIITVDIKIIATMMPPCVLPYQKRGKIYLFIESISQFYRCILSIQPWVLFLMHSYEGPAKMMGIFLTSVYVIAKIIDIITRLQLIKKATWTLMQKVNLGAEPTAEQLLNAGDSCPICHDDYTIPVRLGCGHIFCELCISAWLDREHTCPLCRGRVTDVPHWRDGTTTFDFQLY